jgi:DNA-directed RNA polymerase subunit RPC12/RpoP
MPAWLSRLVLVVFSLLATACAGGALFGAASAETEVSELLVTCLSCGHKWSFAPSATVAAGLLSLVKIRKTADTCPHCGSRVVAFGHAEEDKRQHHGRSA